MDQHDLIVKLKDFAIELGRTPTRDEFVKTVKNGRDLITLLFGSYAVLIQAAGLEPNRPPKITNKIFERSIDTHLDEYSPNVILESTAYPKILILGDVHFPFTNLKALEKVHLFSKEKQPDYIIQIGDLFDMYSHAKFPRSHNIFTPKEEERKSREMAEKMWERFKKDSEQSQLIQILGNHDYRVLKRVLETLPQIEHWVEKYFNELMSFPNVKTILNPREEFKISDIVFIHGHLSGLGKHRDYFLNNIVVGHSHTGGVSYRQVKQKTLWELNSGFVGDQFAKGLSYTPTKTVQWTLGFGYIDEYGPRFIPY